MEQREKYTQACMEAWLNCENLLLCLQQSKTSFSARTLQVVDECAHVCLGAIETIKQSSKNVYQVAFLCLGICEECADLCDRYSETVFKTCAFACRQCSSALAVLASSAI